MKKVLYFAAIAALMTACSSEESTSNDGAIEEAGVEETATGSNDEITRLSEERDKYFELKTEAAGEGNMDDMNMYGHKMDSVDALYQEALRK